MKGIIIYKGKYGATAQYAQWLGEALQWVVHTPASASEKDVQDSNVMVIGTSIYIGKLQIAQWLKNNEPLLRDKKIFLFLVAGTPPSEKEKLDAYIKAGVPASLRKTCTVYYFPGRLLIDRLSFWDRFLLKMGARLTKEPAEKKRMLTDYDHVKREVLADLLTAIKTYSLAAAGVEHTV